MKPTSLKTSVASTTIIRGLSKSNYDPVWYEQCLNGGSGWISDSPLFSPHNQRSVPVPSLEMFHFLIKLNNPSPHFIISQFTTRVLKDHRRDKNIFLPFNPRILTKTGSVTIILIISFKCLHRRSGDPSNLAVEFKAVTA